MNIDLDQVTVRFDGRTVLDNISLKLAERRIGVIGNNGSGKSTLARLLNGLALPDEGRVAVDGLDTRKDGKAVRRKVGFLFQNADNQIVMPTVAEDIALGLKYLGVEREEAAERTEAVLKEFGLANLRDRSAHLLSGGEKQMVALAGITVMQPEIVVCDEPTTLLDRRNARLVAGKIAELACPVIFVTHHVELLGGFERVLVLESGKVVRDGPPDEAVPYYLNNLT